MERNAQSRERLAQLIARLRPEDYGRHVSDDWTVGVSLAHIAFWDRLALARWEQAAQAGERIPRALSDNLADLINAASLQEWQALSPEAIAREAVQAAAAVDARLEQLEAGQVAEAIAAGFVRLIERNRHRNEHMDEIDRAVSTN